MDREKKVVSGTSDLAAGMDCDSACSHKEASCPFLQVQWHSEAKLLGGMLSDTGTEPNSRNKFGDICQPEAYEPSQRADPTPQASSTQDNVSPSRDGQSSLSSELYPMVALVELGSWFEGLPPQAMPPFFAFLSTAGAHGQAAGIQKQKSFLALGGHAATVRLEDELQKTDPFRGTECQRKLGPRTVVNAVDCTECQGSTLYPAIDFADTGSSGGDTLACSHAAPRLSKSNLEGGEIRTSNSAASTSKGNASKNSRPEKSMTWRHTALGKTIRQQQDVAKGEVQGHYLRPFSCPLNNHLPGHKSSND